MAKATAATEIIIAQYTGAQQHRRVIRPQDRETIGVPRNQIGTTNLVFDVTNNFSQDVTAEHPLVIAFFESDAKFSVRRVAGVSPSIEEPEEDTPEESV